MTREQRDALKRRILAQHPHLVEELSTTNDNGRRTSDRQGRSAHTRSQQVEQRWNTQDGINGRTPTRWQCYGSRCALEGAFPERIPPREDVIRAVNGWLDDAERLARMA